MRLVVVLVGLLLAAPALADSPELMTARGTLMQHPDSHEARLTYVRLLIEEADKQPFVQPTTLEQIRRALRQRPATTDPALRQQYRALESRHALLRAKSNKQMVKLLGVLGGESNKVHGVLGRISDLPPPELIGAAARDHDRGGGGLWGGERAEPSPPPPPSGPQPRVTLVRVALAGAQGPAERALSTSMPAIRACYDEILRRRAGAAGSIAWKGTLSAGGVLGQGEVGGSLDDQALRGCVSDRLAQVVWPAVGRDQHLEVELGFTVVAP